jgi:hypothetical protein
MPVTRRKRANPPEEPENNNNHSSEAAQNEQATETVEQIPAPEETSAPAPTPPSAPAAEEQVQEQAPEQAPESTQVSEVAQAAAEQPAEAPRQEETRPSHAPAFAPVPPVPPVTASSPSANGDHPERQEFTPPPHVEGVRRTFRRPSQAQQQAFPQPVQPPQPQPPQPQQPAAAQAPLQPPTHEISLPLGNLLHLAYNPGYTGAEEARSHLLSQLARESKAGGRARCWNCGSIAVVYERWNTRSRTFGEIGIAFCEICGVWSVM